MQDRTCIQTCLTALCYNDGMTMILCDEYQKNTIWQKHSSNGICAGLLPISLHALLKEDALVSKDAMLLECAHLLQDHARQFPIYRAMFIYPAFLQEIIRFAKELCLYQIDVSALPEDNGSEKELKQILSLVMTMDFVEKNMGAKRSGWIDSLSKNKDLIIHRTFSTSYWDALFLKELKEKGVREETDEEGNPAHSLVCSVNVRQELECCAQEICRNPQKRYNIILASYNETYPLLKQVFLRYDIPYTCISEERVTHAGTIYAALLDFAMHKDSESLLKAFRVHAFKRSCPDSLYQFLMQTMKGPCAPKGIAEGLRGTILEPEAEWYARMEEKAQDFFSEIQDDVDLLLSSKTPREELINAYTVFRGLPMFEDKAELRAGMNIRNTLESTLNTIRDETDVQMLKGCFETMAYGTMVQGDAWVTVTDKTHPMDAADVSYVIGCGGMNWPGFPGASGLFDENYVARIEGYPSLRQRYDMYMEQLEWVKHSARESVVWSYATNDYQGREIQLAYEVESMFDGKKAEVRKPAVLRPLKPAAHTLREDLARDIFLRNGNVHASISTVERRYSCAYCYFIMSGLGIRKREVTGIDVRSLGNIQHDVMEKAIRKYGKDYAGISEEEINAILEESFHALSLAWPCYPEVIRLCRERTLSSLLMAFRFLQDMERNSEFRPWRVEEKFEEEIVDHVILHGRIDRMDECNDMVRVIDYKSSARSLNENKVKAGISLQLLTYLLISAKITGKKPMGAYYFSFRDDPMRTGAAKVSRNVVTDTDFSEEAARNAFINARRLSGWTFDENHLVELDEDERHVKNTKTIYDMEECTELMKYLYQDFREKILLGYIDTDPVTGACSFCDYRCICRFHGQYRKIDKQNSTLKKGKDDALRS